jgi:hypothetical protein
MKISSVLTIVIFLMFTGISLAQVNEPSTDPAQPTADTDTDKKVDFTYPQSPVRLPNTPSEDTLIKATKPQATIHDSLVPSVGKKDRNNSKRRGNKKGDNQIDTASTRSSRVPGPL